MTTARDFARYAPALQARLCRECDAPADFYLVGRTYRGYVCGACSKKLNNDGARWETVRALTHGAQTT